MANQNQLGQIVLAVGNTSFLDTLEQITARAKIEALACSIETLNQGLKDLLEETSKYKK